MRSRAAVLRVTIVDVNVATLTAYVTLATVQGALVALPHPAALGRLARLRSPLWAVAAPGSLLVGTFGVLAMPSMATGLAILAGIATPVLALIAVVAVVRGGRRTLLVVPLVLGAVAVIGTGVAAQLAASLLTALGCLTLGVAVTRLTPARWLRLGVVAMAAVDVLLLALGIGQAATTLLGDALKDTGPMLHEAQLGPIRKDYPDLVLSAVLGGLVAGRAIQPRAAVLVAVLATAYGGLFAFADVLPATVPLMLALILIEWRPRVWARPTRAARIPCPQGA